jgi:hypothetical protein
MQISKTFKERLAKHSKDFLILRKTKYTSTIATNYAKPCSKKRQKTKKTYQLKYTI